MCFVSSWKVNNLSMWTPKFLIACYSSMTKVSTTRCVLVVRFVLLKTMNSVLEALRLKSFDWKKVNNFYVSLSKIFLPSSIEV